MLSDRGSRARRMVRTIAMNGLELARYVGSTGFVRRPGFRSMSGIVLQSGEELVEGGWIWVGVDGVVEVGHHAGNATARRVELPEGDGWFDGDEPGSVELVHFREGAQVRLGKALIEYDAFQGVGEVVAGTMGKMPVDAGGGYGVAGGPAEGRGSAFGVAGSQVGASAVEVEMAALPVSDYGADGGSSFTFTSTSMDKMDRIFCFDWVEI